MRLSARRLSMTRRERLSERVAARGRRRRWMHGVHEQRNHRQAAVAHEIEDRLGMRVRQELAVLRNCVRPGDVEAFLHHALDQRARDLADRSDRGRVLAVPVVGE